MIGRDNAQDQMKRIMTRAREMPGVWVSTGYRGKDGENVNVSAKANRIGFVYWNFNGKPMPRKAVEAQVASLELLW